MLKGEERVGKGKLWGKGGKRVGKGLGKGVESVVNGWGKVGKGVERLGKGW